MSTQVGFFEFWGVLSVACGIVCYGLLQERFLGFFYGTLPISWGCWGFDFDLFR